MTIHSFTNLVQEQRLVFDDGSDCSEFPIVFSG